MQIRTERLSLQLENPFKLSYGATTVRENVAVQISDGVHTGFGEAAVVPYYGETPERVIEYLSSPALTEALGDNPLWLEEILERLPAAKSNAPITAVDIALHDLWGKHLGQPLYRLWGLNPANCPVSSYTVSMADDDDAYRELLRKAINYPLVKLKLGGGSIETDLRLVHIAREELHAKLCVDANGGWSANEALAVIPKLAELEMLFIEQPVAKDNMDGWRLLRESLTNDMPPLIADESVQSVQSVMQLAGLVDGINVKLVKCGGLRPARRMISLARAYGMQVMIGCMVESSIAITAAAHLSPLVDYADLDGNLLINNDPFTGAKMVNGKLILPDTPGLGVSAATPS